MSDIDLKKFAVKKPRRRRWLLKSFVILILAVIGFYFAAPSGVGWIIGSKLQSELATRLNARLDFGRVLYEYPYGVRIEKAHLLMPGANGAPDSWIDVGRLELTLAKLPLGTGPLVIEKLVIEKPLVRLASGSPAPVDPGTTAPPAPTAPPASSQKLSDLFQLRSINITAGQFEYDMSTPAHPVPPIVWGHLSASLNTQPTAGGTYHFDVSVQDDPIAIAKAAGSFDIDALQLNLEKFSVAITADPSKRPAQVPAQALDLIEKYQVGGQLRLDGNAMLPLKTLDKSTFNATLSLKDAHGQPPGFAAAIEPTEFSIRSSNQNGLCTFDLVAKDQQLAAVTATGTVDLSTFVLDLSKLDISIQCDPQQPCRQLPDKLATVMNQLQVGGQLNLNGCVRLPLNDPLRALYAANVELKNGQCKLPNWSGPLSPAKFSFVCSNIAGVTGQSLPKTVPSDLPTRPAESHLWLTELSATSGNQIFKLTGGEITFDPVNKNYTIEKIDGLADVGDGPGPLEGANTRFIIPFVATGHGKLGDESSSVQLMLDDSSAVFTQNHIRINRMNGTLIVTPSRLTSYNLVAKCADGQIKAAGTLAWKVPQNGPATALVYGGNFDLSQLDLHQLAMQYTTDAALRQKAFGLLDWHQKFHGSVLQNGPDSGHDSFADRLVGQGDFDITNGYFLDIPILKNIVMAMHMNNASTVGEAAATFDIARSVVTFTRIGANSPALGVQGKGTLGFDQKVKMDFVATPLADWGKDVKNTGLFSNAATAVVGKAQDIVNGLQGQLYSFRASGLISNPRLDAVPVPILTDAISPLFKKMAGNKKQGSVAAELNKQQVSEEK